jgi:hypothetical protein
MLLQEFPVIKEDNAMMRSYMFIIDFLEAVVKETSTMLQQNQLLMKKLLQNAQDSEEKLDIFIDENKNKVNYINCLVYIYIT